jgi:hypothetical protein
MGLTRTPKPKEQESLQAAVMPLKSTSKDVYLSNREMDLIVNSSLDKKVELAWYYYESVPELRYIIRYIANAVSQARLYVGRVTSDPTNPEILKESHPASQLLESFAGGMVGQSEMLDQLAVQLTLIGDSRIAGPKQGKNAPEPFDKWNVFSINEIVSRNGQLFYTTADGRELPLPNNVKALRVWRRHPRNRWLADSPTRSSMRVLREIDMLDKHVNATGTSRLSGAGLLLLSDEMSFPVNEVETDGVETDNFVKFFAEVMSIAIKNPDSAAARVPIIGQGSAEAIQAARYMTFSTPFDEQVPELRQKDIRRLSLGMDILPEILLGFSDTNSWGSWQSDETTQRIHITPLLQIITGALTIGWLRPTLRELPLSKTNQDMIDSLVIWFDLSNLRVKPNVTEEAQNMYDRFAIGQDTLRRVSGLTESDSPTGEELELQILLKLIENGNPQLVGYAIDALTAKGVINLPDATEANVRSVVRSEGAPPTGSQPGTSETPNGLPGDRSFDKTVTIPVSDPTNPDPHNNHAGAVGK